MGKDRAAGIADGRLRPSPRENQAPGHAAFAKSLWRIAVLAAAGVIGGTSYAEAAVAWSDSDAGFSRPTPQRRHRAHRHSARKIDATVKEKESAKPQGPLIIAISIDKQKLKIYDSNGFFAEAPVSTGMKGHPTPMGVFSVIEKDRYHHSNIYSGAPMPYMQRITWSGVAMHAGVLPGYPASHGCIRMPPAFAVKMWGWTKMGARVVVTPGEITPPESFSHPLLATEKVPPQPAAAVEPMVDAPAKPEKTADAAPLREQTHTADASASLPATTAPVTMSDATQSSGNTPTHEAATAETEPAPAGTVDAVKSGDAPNADVKSEVATSETAKSETESTAEKPGEKAPSDDSPAEVKSSESATSTTKPVEADASDNPGQKPDEATVSAQASSDTAKTEVSATENTKADETRVEAKVDDLKTSVSDTPKPIEAKSTEVKPAEVKPAEVKSVETKPAEKSGEKTPPAADTAAIPDAKKDQTRLQSTEKAAAPKPDPVTAAAPKRTGQIAVFISRKDSKLYVRQNFKPLFSVPVTIAADDRPLGTHVFTAQVDKDDANLLHWSVVSIPARHVERRDEDEHVSRRRKKTTEAAEVKVMPVPDSPAEALNRITIPADAMARIAESLSTGGSIVVSDQGINAGETGEGTDFIVSLR
ncbi:L,D-transpeptidase family protein [Bradyrhizobium sp.]|uniref:L,D-transpeptidase family protein n=1 Tax=Bradyrhizobium sp. TaxID=376 RepID=UPI0025C39E9B|nr:L,D-transpeptidase family protein [Bradyrhizobium sp.]